LININEIDLIVFDFDGVLTNNYVYVDQVGNEIVRCSRADGLAFDVLRKLEKEILILSSEKNVVVFKRAKKLQLNVIHGVENKLNSLKKYIEKNEISMHRVMYIGNDINDFSCMQLCGVSGSPYDAHPSILAISDFTLSKKGGDGVVRDLVENIFKINPLDILFK
tara:strand:- start:318 stop:812 length:495 start_codon:yes stop_codon:yes gene_type:complete